MTDEPREPEQDGVGSVGEEAAKLLEALQGWAAGANGGIEGPGLADHLRTVNEHIATGGTDCAYCPVCQMIAKAREASPEVRTHLAVGASSLLQAAAAFIESRAPKAPRTGAENAPGQPHVTKIDLDDAPPPPGGDA